MQPMGRPVLGDDTEELRRSALSTAPSCLLADCPEADVFAQDVFPICFDLLIGIGACKPDAEQAMDDWLAIFVRSWHAIVRPGEVAPAVAVLLHWRRIRRREILRATYRARHAAIHDENGDLDGNPGDPTTWLDHFLASVDQDVAETLNHVLDPWSRQNLAELLDVPPILLGVNLASSWKPSTVKSEAKLFVTSLEEEGAR